MEIKGHKWKLFGSQTPDADPDEYRTTHADGKVGVGVACWMGPQYPCAPLPVSLASAAASVHVGLLVLT